MRFIPLGSKMLILPQETKNYTTGTDIEIIQTALAEGIVVEVSDEYESMFPIGQRIVYSGGAGQSYFYNGKQCLIIDCRSIDRAGDIFFKIVEDKIEL